MFGYPHSSITSILNHVPKTRGKCTPFPCSANNIAGASQQVPPSPESRATAWLRGTTGQNAGSIWI